MEHVESGVLWVLWFETDVDRSSIVDQTGKYLPMTSLYIAAL